MKFPFSSSTAAEPAGTYALTSELKVPPVTVGFPVFGAPFNAGTPSIVATKVPPFISDVAFALIPPSPFVLSLPINTAVYFPSEVKLPSYTTHFTSSSSPATYKA